MDAWYRKLAPATRSVIKSSPLTWALSDGLLLRTVENPAPILGHPKHETQFQQSTDEYRFSTSQALFAAAFLRFSMMRYVVEPFAVAE
jgi:hypothetical protein